MAIQPFRATFSAAALLAAGQFLAPAYAEGPMSWAVGAATDDTHVEVLRDGWGYESSGSQRGFSARGALELSRNFELELGAMSASDLHWTEYFSGYQGYLTAHTTFDVRALNVSAVGKVVGRTFEGYIKAGVARYTVDGRQVLDTLMIDAAATRDVHAHSCSSGPECTTSPPSTPARGPMSTIQSAAWMVSSSCSTTISVLPRSRSVMSVSMRRRLSRWWRPIDGSSSTYRTPVRPEPICVASRMRCASPPERDPAERLRLR